MSETGVGFASTDHDMQISVVIPCYDRMALLRRTLAACFAQQGLDGISWEIIVVDNHQDAFAIGVVAELTAASPVELRYVAAPARNIAKARNVGVAASRGRFIAFIDDDEAPGPAWLVSFYRCLERTGADAAFGPKLPEFQGGTPPAWSQNGDMYTTDFGLPADTPINTVFGSPRRGRALGTGNSMFRVATCLSERLPFNEVGGEFAGEDTELFVKLLAAGRRFVWCPDAVVCEFIPEHRLDLMYLYHRLVRGSKISARCRVRFSRHPHAATLMILVVGLGQLVVHGTLLVLSGEIFGHDRARHRLGVARGLGKLTHRLGDIAVIQEPPIRKLSETSGGA